jgi:hypothetical protein
MSVEIDPVELGFHRPFTQEVSQILKIKNPNHTPVAFKVKTTAPKQYCVRPNSGRIEPGKEVEVTGASNTLGNYVSVLIYPRSSPPSYESGTSCGC